MSLAFMSNGLRKIRVIFLVSLFNILSLNQMHAHCQSKGWLWTLAWFTKIFSEKCVCMYVCTYVCVLHIKTTQLSFWTISWFYIKQKIHSVFNFFYFTDVRILSTFIIIPVFHRSVILSSSSYRRGLVSEEDLADV